jgi:hypothetical protein
LALIFSMVFAFQAEARFSKTSAALDTTWINGDVLTEAMALTKATKRDLTVYSYVARANIDGFGTAGAVDVTNPGLISNAMDNATDRMSRFWNVTDVVSGRSSEGGAMAPNGLYVATEPVISRTYGNVIYRMVIPSGTRFIDGRYRPGPKVGAHLLAALQARGCTNPLPVTDANPVFAARNLVKSDTKQTACRQALMEIAEATGSKAVLYIFKSEPIPFCVKTYAWNSAFVLIEEDAIKANSFQPIVVGQSDEKDGLEQERQLLNGVFANANLAAPFPRSTVAVAADAEKYMADHYMACNPQINEK